MADWLNPLQHVHTMACCVLRKQLVSSVVLTSKVLPDRAVNGKKKSKLQNSVSGMLPLGLQGKEIYCVNACYI